jgi:hypothetical protein
MKHLPNVTSFGTPLLFDDPAVAYTSPQTPCWPSYDTYMSPSHILMTGNSISYWLSPPCLAFPFSLTPLPTPTRHLEASLDRTRPPPYSILHCIHSIYLCGQLCDPCLLSSPLLPSLPLPDPTLEKEQMHRLLLLLTMMLLRSRTRLPRPHTAPHMMHARPHHTS